MPKLLPALAARAAVVAAAAVAAVLPVTTAAAPAAASAPPVSRPAAFAAAPMVSAPAAAPVVTTPVVHVARSSSVMSLALDKLGAPYRWGAAGPNAFDCSGLVKWAYAQTGVALPRTSRAMSQVGTPVSKANLQPGDLVFFYHPVSHVAIYIGDGKVVHAGSSRSPVKISNLDAMPFTSARRI